MCENPDIIHTNTGVIHEGLKVAKRLKYLMFGICVSIKIRGF